MARYADHGHLDGHGLLDMDEHDEHDDLLQHVNGVAPGPGTDLLPNTDPPKIRVVVRTRPLSGKEVEKGDEDIVTVDMTNGILYVDEPKQKVDLTKFVERHKFVFDDSLDHSVSNDVVYSYTVQPLVHTIFKEGKATCFAYGQTGSGKTYTMSPLPPRAAAEILTLLNTPNFCDLGLFVSCFEIYGNKVYDLLNGRKKLEVREDGRRRVNVVGLKEWHVTETGLVAQLIEHASAARCTGQTGANSESSRSHSIMQFSLKKPTKSGEPGGREVGRLSFIDLAGSERGADTFDNDRQTRMEGADINKSLLALKECIRALDGDAPHVPFRGAKLTECLRDSFVGEQARTVMIANISPSSSSVEHTLNTLRYADRVKELRKDKRQRSAGSVTPGKSSTTYNISAQRNDGAGGDAPAPRMKPAAMPGAAAATAQAAPAARSSYRESPPPSGATNPQRQPFVPRPVQSGAEGALGYQAQGYQPQGHQAQAYPTQGPGYQPQAAAPPPGASVTGMVGMGGAGASSVGGSVGPRHQHQHSHQQSLDAEADARVMQAQNTSMMTAREELMNAILQEEDELIQDHRKAIEETMNTVRSEMNLLAEVDQPGSAIDTYVTKLEEILIMKDRANQLLRAKLASFKAKLREEELLTQTVGQQMRGR